MVPFLLSGCDRKDSAPASETTQQVVIYSSIDQPVLLPIIRDFEKQSGIKVMVQGDTEATKTAGLAERLRAEKDNPQADVYWGNEVFHTINLANEGVLAPYASPAAADIPALFRDPGNLWASTGLRARVIAMHLPGPDALPHPVTGLESLTRPGLKGKICMARPVAGTTSGHVAAIWVLWGEEKAKAYFRDLRANGVKLLGGNGPVAEQVGAGTMLAGLTDNDDVAATQREGGKLTMVVPDQTDFGTLTIPTTVALVKGARNDAAAKKLIDYLLSPEVEKKLLEAQFARWSVRGEGAGGIKSMAVDYREVAKIMPRAVRETVAILEGRNE